MRLGARVHAETARAFRRESKMQAMSLCADGRIASTASRRRSLSGVHQGEGAEGEWAPSLPLCERKACFGNERKW